MTPSDDEIVRYELSPDIARQALGAFPTPVAGARVRPLRVYTLDPSLSDRMGGVATINVPFEDVAAGPVGALFAVDFRGAPRHLDVGPLDLNDPAILLRGGLSPSPGNGRFHLQMVYAVCNVTYALFRRALGRDIVWSCGQVDPETKRRRLTIRPFGLRARNAFFSRDLGALTFGYFAARKSPAGFSVPRGPVFTALSHDIVVHETTHALLDALRSQFATPTNRDVLGFHEGFADIVALLQHFSYPEVVAQGIRQSRGELSRASLLAGLAQEFGNALAPADRPGPMRTAVDVAGFDAGDGGFDSDGLPGPARGKLRRYRPDMEEHEMGLVLATAVFEAFVTVFRRKSERYLRLAGIAPDRIGDTDLSDALVACLASEAADVASRMLDICIRAIDYCPPIDLRLGEYLRAIVTADADVVADDRYGYREAIMRSFRRRDIFPDGVRYMTEDALRWEPPPEALVIEGLAFRNLKFAGDPGRPADEDEAVRQANVLGAFISDPRHARALRLVSPARPPAGVQQVSPPRIESLRATRRVAPNGSVLFDLVAEITQTLTVLDASGDGQPFEFFGGCTLLIDPDGRIRYTIAKRLDDARRQRRQRDALRGGLQHYWEQREGRWRPRKEVFRLLHGAPTATAAAHDAAHGAPP